MVEVCMYVLTVHEVSLFVHLVQYLQIYQEILQKIEHELGQVYRDTKVNT